MSATLSRPSRLAEVLILFRHWLRLGSRLLSSRRQPATPPAPTSVFDGGYLSETSLGSEGAVETLEARQMLAGNVSVVVRGTNIFVNGDAASNNIAIQAQANAILFQGLLDDVGIPTAVNGQAAFVLTGGNEAFGNLRIVMKGGNDRVDLDLTVRGTLAVSMGSGSDAVEVTSVVSRSMNVNMGPAGPFNEFVVISNTDVSGRASVVGGGGTQQMLVNASRFFGSSRFSLGGGNDLLQINNNNVFQFSTLRANGGGGVDRILSPFAPVRPTISSFEIFA